MSHQSAFGAYNQTHENNEFYRHQKHHGDKNGEKNWDFG